jgi:hypothetical protein
MLGPAHAYIFRHHFAHTILVVSAERPGMPLLGALVVEKRTKEAVQRNRPHYKDAAKAFKEDDSKKKVAASGATSEANKAAIWPTAW